MAQAAMDAFVQAADQLVVKLRNLPFDSFGPAQDTH
jgi:hypothetical protein